MSSADSPRTFVRLKAFLAEPEETVTWVIDGLLPSGGLSVLGAKPKVGKSTLARVMAHAVSTETPCLGRQTSRGVVLYVSIEERRSDVRRHLALLGSADDPGLLVHVGPVPGKPSGTSREAIRRHRVAWLTAQLERFEPSLVVIDTFALFMSLKDTNDYSEVTEAAAPVIALARSSGAHFLFTHHARKQDAELIDALVGSTGIVGFVDTVMLLRRHRDGTRTIASNQRVGDEFDETVLSLDKTTGMVGIGGSLDDARLEAAIQQYVVRLVRVSSATERELRADITGPTELLVRALREALSRGLIERSGAGKPGNPYRYSLSRTTYQTNHTDETNHTDQTDHTDEMSGVSGSSGLRDSGAATSAGGAEPSEQSDPDGRAKLCSCGAPAVSWSSEGDGWCWDCWEQRSRS
jgi:hypothetical protein